MFIQKKNQDKSFKCMWFLMMILGYAQLHIYVNSAQEDASPVFKVYTV